MNREVGTGVPHAVPRPEPRSLLPERVLLKDRERQAGCACFRGTKPVGNPPRDLQSAGLLVASTWAQRLSRALLLPPCRDW